MLSKKAKYAIRALIVLAEHQQRFLGTGEIAAEGAIPRKFLENIVQELRMHGLLKSKRGIFGGYALTRPPAEIFVGDVVRLIDGPLAPIRCASLTSYRRCEDCPDEAQCAIRRTMSEVRNAISGVLDRKSIGDMLGVEVL